MKRLTAFAVCLALLFAFAGCGTDRSDIELVSGKYYLVGDYEEHMTPCLWLDMDENTFVLGAGLAVSYAERGSFEVSDGKLTATSQSTTYAFEIKDSQTLMLTDIGDKELFQLPENAEFVFKEDIH